jgi:hypothetical protein
MTGPKSLGGIFTGHYAGIPILLCDALVSETAIS